MEESPHAITEEAIDRVRTSRLAEKEPELEAQLSVNDYIGRLQNAAKTAHGAARYGEVTAETECWVDIAAIAVARIEYLLQVE